MSFEFNEQQRELIKEYQKLLHFGYSKISEIQLNLNKTRVRKRVLYFMMGAMQGYSESILKLMGSEPVYEKPGESLLRSQFEIWLNMRFIYSNRSENGARLFLSDLIMTSNTFAKKHKKLWEKNPKWSMEFGFVKKPSDWDKFIYDNQKILKKYQKRHKDKEVNRLPSLYDRTLIIDEYLKKVGTFSENNSAEKFYTVFWQYLSQATHVNMSALQQSIRVKGTIPIESFFNIDSKPEDAERTLTISYQIYFSTLRLFLQVFNTYNRNEYEKFNKFS